MVKAAVPRTPQIPMLIPSHINDGIMAFLIVHDRLIRFVVTLSSRYRSYLVDGCVALPTQADPEYILLGRTVEMRSVATMWAV